MNEQSSVTGIPAWTVTELLLVVVLNVETFVATNTCNDEPGSTSDAAKFKSAGAPKIIDESDVFVKPTVDCWAVVVVVVDVEGPTVDCGAVAIVVVVVAGKPIVD